MQTLFSELAVKFTPFPENMATEALLYLLKSHQTSWPILRSFCEQTGVSLPNDLLFESQVWSKDNSQPDIVGKDVNGNRVLVIESKFWADLTKNQPMSYIRSLNKDLPAVMIVISPDRRLQKLWKKLLNVIMIEDNRSVLSEGGEQEFIYSNLSSEHRFAILSWRKLLSTFMSEAETQGDRSFYGDTLQLLGLCQRMDSEAFLPIIEEDLSQKIAIRIQNFADLIDEIIPRLRADGFADTDGLTTGGTQSEYGRYFRTSSLGIFLSFCPKRWARYGDFPLWLRVKERTDSGWIVSGWLKEVTHELLSRGYFVPRDEDYSYVGLNMAIGVDKYDLLGNLETQIREIIYMFETRQHNKGLQPVPASDTSLT